LELRAVVLSGALEQTTSYAVLRMASVILKHLDKRFPGGVHAVRDLCLEIADGEFFVLVGPSGCGKSTTLRMIAGLEEPSAGEIYFGDRLMNGVPPAGRDVAMVFQNYALYPHMSVYENMAFGLKMRRTPRADIDRRVRDSAQLLSIESLLDRRPGELSGGQRQRVAVGRAIVREPKVFLFDEPLSNLDTNLRIEMRAEIARLHRRLAATIIYVTHDQAEAMTLGSRIVLLNHGEIQQIDTPMNIYKRPANQFVASFIGSPAINFLPGVVRGGVFELSGQNGEAAVPAVKISESVPDGPAQLGVRPEDLLPCGEGPSLGTITFDVVEEIGHETIAYFALADRQHVARLPAHCAVQPGDQLPLAIRPGAVHLFSAEDGQRLN
jgi:ABC-type sugar transport system ATPase subunit